MDPYIIVEHNKKKYRTKTIKKGGQHPIWGTEEPTSHFIIPLSDLGE